MSEKGKRVGPRRALTMPLKRFPEIGHFREQRFRLGALQLLFVLCDESPRPAFSFASVPSFIILVPTVKVPVFTGQIVA